MKQTYEQAISQVFRDEGGYTNEATDPGGPTNFGITIHDAQKYWKADATANDVRTMPKSVAEDIYRKHYADVVWYDSLPPGVDYTVLDYAINSGVSKSIKTLQGLVNVTQDGIMGPVSLQAVALAHPDGLIQKIWEERLNYDKSLTNLWPTYGHGWTNRITRGQTLAMSLFTQFINLFTRNTTTMPANTTEAPVHPATASPTTSQPFQFDPATFLADIEQALEAANTMLPALLPVIGAFYPPAAALVKFLPLLPTVLNAVVQVQTNLQHSNPAVAIAAVQDQLTPGQPNTPALN